MEGFFAFIFYLILGFYLLQWLVRFWFRRKIRKLQRDMEQNGGQNYYKQYTWGQRNGGQRERPTREGEVEVDTRTTPDKKINDRIGDYVDFEEIE